MKHAGHALFNVPEHMMRIIQSQEDASSRNLQCFHNALPGQCSQTCTLIRQDARPMGGISQ